MRRKLLFCVLVLYSSLLWAQENNSPYKTKKIIATHDTISIEKTSINATFFKVLDTQNQIIDTAFYKINFQKEILFLIKTFL